MFPQHFILRSCLLLPLLVWAAESQAESDFDTFLKPLFAKTCTKCHGEKKVKGKGQPQGAHHRETSSGQAKLIKEMIEVIDAYDMPPEDEPKLDEQDRTKLLASLKTMLREATAGTEAKQVQIRRLNRFQYNNSIKDLFQLKGNVFPLTEKLLTRHENYVHAKRTRCRSG